MSLPHRGERRRAVGRAGHRPHQRPRHGDACRRPKAFRGAPEQIRDDLQRLQSLGVEGVMWDLTQAEVPFNTQFRLLERLRRAAS